MKIHWALFGFALVLVPLFYCESVAASNEGDGLTLVEAGAPSCKIVVITNGESELLLSRSVDLIAGTVHDWSGAKLHRVELNKAQPDLPADSAIIFTTLNALKKCAPELSSKQEFAKAAEINEHGFLCVPQTRNNIRHLFVVSQTARGVMNGAWYLRDFCIDGTKENLAVECRSFVRSPKMGGRAAYHLTIWGNEAAYTADDWATIFESFARDGIDRIYFWTSGHFPSKKFPQTYRCKTVEGGKTYDTTVDSKIGTVDELKKIIRSAHNLGMKIYLGGGLGSWCGTVHLTKDAPGTMKQGNKEASLCPSHPQSRKALVEYYQEMFAALPDADGLFIESADEVGDCDCAACSKAIDALGSKQFGQAQLTLCQEIMDAVWRDHPHARLAYTIGYPEHVNDVAYYKHIQRLSSDPRFEWMEARNSWSFPGPVAEPQPARYFSGQVMRWKQWYKMPLENMIADANRLGKEEWYGMIWSFEPGYATGSFYHDIPFPTDILPYALTGFVYREVTWNPNLTVEEMLDRTQQRFFGKDAPKHLATDLWKLREMIRRRKGLNELVAIEKHIEEARLSASPKTIAGLDLMTRATHDLRKHLKK